MVSITPDTDIYLTRVPFNSTYEHTIDFDTENAQKLYFDSNIIKSFSDYAYSKIDNYIDVGANIDSIINANYLFYKNGNKNQGFKTYFCFIKNMEWLSENSTRIYFITDVFQTYMFDYEIKSSFIEREHVASDKIGEHTIPEPLEVGEYVINASYRDQTMDNLNVVMASTASPGELVYFGGGTYNGIPSAVDYYNLGNKNNFDSETTIKPIINGGKADAISSLFLAPSYLFQENNPSVPESSDPHTYTINIDDYDTLDTYEPKNNKCLVYPYRYVLINNGQNGSAIYNYENWKPDTLDGERKFEVDSVLCSGCAIRGVPLNYKGEAKNNLEGLNLGKFPELNWVTDPYINWLTENGLNMGTDIAIGRKIVEGGARAVQGDLVGSLSTVTNALEEQYIADLQPPQVRGNGNVGDLITSSKNNCFHIYYMSIKREYARILDNYFNMFGYRVNSMGVPNLKSRAKWNFIKTIGINIETEIIPEEHLIALKSIFNNGITIWHDPFEIMNYSLDNSIVGGLD